MTGFNNHPDGRFGSGPARIPEASFQILSQYWDQILGHSHRGPVVKDEVRHFVENTKDLLQVPDGYEVVLGNGGSTGFFGIVATQLVAEQSQHVVQAYGGFSEKLYQEVAAAHYIEPPLIKLPLESLPWEFRDTAPIAPGTLDTLVLTQNETVAGIVTEIIRPEHDPLVVVDATSSAGAMETDLTRTDVYFYSLQKAMASEGGLWVAVLSPKAIERAIKLREERRTRQYIAPILDLPAAIEASRQNQTVNTPAIAPIILANVMLEQYIDEGGLPVTAKRSREMSDTVYDFAKTYSEHGLEPFPLIEADRSPVTPVILCPDEMDVDGIVEKMREQGVYDIGGYRSLKDHEGKKVNSFRIATFPQIDPEHLGGALELLGQTIEASVGK